MLKLNPEQQEAVFYDQGPLLLIAGAGTGKTSVITQRIVNLINSKKARPEEILAVTFTEKASKEMEERVDLALPIGYIELWIKTFHGFAHAILEDHGLDIGLANDFKLVDQTTAWMLVKKNLEKFALDYYRPLGNPTKFIHALLDHFSRCKDEGIYPEDYLKYSDSLKKDLQEEKSRLQEVANAYHVYQQILLDNNLLDFGDLINYCLKLFKERPQILKKYREKFKYILIDEFQDTNYVQYELIKLLLNENKNILVSADDDQAIYRWRGASFNNIIQFSKDFSKARKIVLKENFRSSQKILDLSYNFIQKNNPDRLECREKVDKKLTAHSQKAGEIKHYHFKSLEEEARGVAKKIKSLYEASWNDFAILIRANSSAGPFMLALEEEKIPYQFLASRGLYSKKIILDLISFFKLLDNYHESLALNRVLSMPMFGYDIKDLARLNYLAKRKTLSLYEAIGQIPLIEKYSRLAPIKKPSELLIKFLGEDNFVKTLNPEDISYINQFLDRIKKFEAEALDPSLKFFLEVLAMELESGESGKLKFDLDLGPDMVKVMTVHSAKGLEFERVFVVSLVEDRFPSRKRSEAIELPEELMKEILPQGDYHIQEERRLFYVALTRAKSGLYLTSADDYGGARDKRVSKFIAELNIDKSPAENYPTPLAFKSPAINRQLPVPQSFSFSQLNLFKRCPFKYYLTYVLKVPMPGSAALSYGLTMHGVLCKFLKNSWSQKDLFGQKPKPLSYPNLIKLYEEFWIDDWFDSKKIKEDYYQQGLKSLKLFYDDFINSRPEIKALEQNFVLDLSNYSLRGRIDRMDSDNRIIDYKTGHPKEKLDSEDKLQLILYQIAAQEVLGIKPPQLTFYYLNDGSKLSFSASDKEIVKAKESVLKIIKEIEKGEFSCRCYKPEDVCLFYDPNVLSYFHEEASNHSKF